MVPRRSGLSRKHREWLAAALFLLPDALGLFVFLGIPMILALSLGFFEVSGFGDYTFIGLDNYRQMLKDPLFIEEPEGHRDLCRDLRSCALCLGTWSRAAGQAAFAVYAAFPGDAFPAQCHQPGRDRSDLAVHAGRAAGMVNKVLYAAGFRGAILAGRPRYSHSTRCWSSRSGSSPGYYMLIFLAGLQEIPREFYEASRIDGASAWRMFRDITIPLSQADQSFFVLLDATVTAVAGGQGFDLVFVMTQGGPANSTSLIVFYIYQQAFQFSHYGYAAAMASFLVAVLVCLTGILFVVTKGGRFEFD